MKGDEQWPKEAWIRVGELLKQRRPQIDPRYHKRRAFARDTGIPDKTIQEVENAYRSTFSSDLIAGFETAYRLAAGSIREVLENPGLPDFPRKLNDRLPAADTAFVPSPNELDSMEPWEAHLWRTPQLSDFDRQTLIDLQHRIHQGRSHGKS
jgi:hypothetical protein